MLLELKLMYKPLNRCQRALCELHIKSRTICPQLKLFCKQVERILPNLASCKLQQCFRSKAPLRTIIVKFLWVSCNIRSIPPKPPCPYKNRYLYIVFFQEYRHNIQWWCQAPFTLSPHLLYIPTYYFCIQLSTSIEVIHRVINRLHSPHVNNFLPFCK